MPTEPRANLSEPITGVCSFENEGFGALPYWAFQDSRYIQKNAHRGFCKKCGKWLRAQKGDVIRILKTVTLSVDDIKKILNLEELTGSAREALSKEIDERPECPDGTHEEDIGDLWSYDGHHRLNNGDFLTIFSKENPEKQVWSGAIDLQSELIVTPHTLSGKTIAPQKGMDYNIWFKYFIDEYPATLTLKQ